LTEKHLLPHPYLQGLQATQTHLTFPQRLCFLDNLCCLPLGSPQPDPWFPAADMAVAFPEAEEWKGITWLPSELLFIHQGLLFAFFHCSLTLLTLAELVYA